MSDKGKRKPVGRSRDGSKGADNDSGNVGYGKPPVEHQFKPGRSGNPNGRPKGTPNHASILSDANFSAMFQAERDREIKLNSPDGPTTLSAAQAVVRATFLSAIKGGTRPQKYLMELFRAIDQDKIDTRVEGIILRHQVEQSYPEGMKRVRAQMLRSVWEKRRSTVERRLEHANAEYKSLDARAKRDAKDDLSFLRDFLAKIDEAIAGNEDSMDIIEQTAADQPELVGEE